MEVLSRQFQVHFFCDNADLPASPENIKKMIDTLGGVGLIPNTGHEINGATGQRTPYITMIDTKSALSVQFPPREVAIFDQDVKPDEFFEKVRGVMNCLYDSFRDKKGYRVSFLYTLIAKGSDQDYSSIYGANFQGGESPFEWDCRKVFRKEVGSEQVNSIRNIRRCEVQSPNGNFVDSIMFDVDCNTIFQDARLRFDFNNAIPVLEDLKEEALESFRIMVGDYGL